MKTLDTTATEVIPPGGPKSTAMHVANLDRVDYDRAFALQEQLAANRAVGRAPDSLLLLEHPPTITLGRRGSRADIYASDEQLAAAGIVVRETNRGGLVTYHGPGQVVGYLIANLAEIAGSAPELVRRLEEGLIRTLSELGIAGYRRDAHRGVFTHQGKIAAIGIGVRRGVTMHGFALNLQPDLRHFALINPCGIGDLGVTSVERLRGAPADPVDVHRALAFHLGEVFRKVVLSETLSF